MTKPILKMVKRADQVVSQTFLKFFPEKPALLAFFFHAIFSDDREMSCNLIAPLEGTTIQRFRQFVEYYLDQGYTFISADDLAKGIERSKKYVMATFDDGYANNQLVLPILREYQVPATFFVTTTNVIQNICFWWDVLHRERFKRGGAIQEIEREANSLKSEKHLAIEKYVRDLFGEDAFHPISDLDRPFSLSELKAFSKEPTVCLGNHTHNHAILTNYSEDEIQTQISEAQQVLRDVLGRWPTAIAYPNGRYSPAVIRVARQAGLKFGFTVLHRKNYLPIQVAGDQSMCLSRFHISRKRELIKQCELFRSDVLVYPRIRYFFKGAED